MQSYNRTLFLAGFNLCVRCYFIPKLLHKFFKTRKNKELILKRKT